MSLKEVPFVIAEIGCNHKGDVEIAKALIDQAVFCKATVAKFQKRHPKELLSEAQYNAPHPNAHHSYGDTYGAHREFLELDLEQNRELKRYCEEKGIIYSTSVWDITSTNEIISLDPDLIKVPSAANTNMAILELLRDTYKGEIHISLGMTTREEEAKVIDMINQKADAAQRTVLYACTSGYPVPFEDVCLLEITRLKEQYGKQVKAIGFSGHHLGIAVDVAAYALGATHIERHFTLDRTWKGTDHAASLEPTGLQKLVRDLRATKKALTFKSKEILDIESPQRHKLKVS